MPVPRITIVTPAFNEEAMLPLFAENVRKTLFSRTDYSFQVLIVDDGSVDGTWKAIEILNQADARFSGIRLSRNFGAHVADSAGLANADGDAVAILACDLQDPPAVVLEFLDQWRAGAKVVWGHRRSRKDSLWKRAASSFFNRLLRTFILPGKQKFVTGGFLLMDRQVVSCFNQFPERNRLVFALVALTGFEQAVVEYDRQERVAGNSRWSLMRMIKSMYDAFIGFSPFPVRMITVIGLAAFALSVPLAIYFVYCKLSGLNHLVGWTGLMLALDMSFGVQFLLTGIMGEYLFRIYTEVTQRPLFFISQRTGADRTVTERSTFESANQVSAPG